MSDKPTLQDLLEVQKYFGLPSPALVEKDWYIVKALAAITAVDTTPFRLLFGGGTALSRAHRLTRRMSEDIDLKIVVTGKPPRSAFRRLRDTVTNALLAAGFAFDPANPAHCESGNASRYMLYHLPYEPLTAGEGALRPEIQIEIATWPLRRPTVNRALTSFISEANGRAPEVEMIECVSVVETAAEKFVALTRRAGTELAMPEGPHDPTLVRHVYDLHVTRGLYDLAEFAELARDIMLADAKAYGHKFPAYRDNPMAETHRAIAGLASNPRYAEQFAIFIRDMIYGERPSFEEAFDTVTNLAEQLRGDE